MSNLKEFAEHLQNLTAKEVQNLSTVLKEQYNIEACKRPVLLTSDTVLYNSKSKVKPFMRGTNYTPPKKKNKRKND